MVKDLKRTQGRCYYCSKLGKRPTGSLCNYFLQLHVNLQLPKLQVKKKKEKQEPNWAGLMGFIKHTDL